MKRMMGLLLSTALVVGSAVSADLAIADEDVAPIASGGTDSTIMTGGAAPLPTDLDSVPARRTDSGTGTVGQGNLVLLVRFAGDTVGDYETVSKQDGTTTQAWTGFNSMYAYDETDTIWHRFMLDYNAVDRQYSAPSVRDLIYTYSQGKHDLISSFPQTTNDLHVEYLTLDHEASHYASKANSAYLDDAALAKDALAKFQQRYPNFDTSEVNTNADSYVDCLTVIPQVPAGLNGWTSHSSNIGGQGVKLGSLDVAEFNLIDSKSFSSGTAQTQSGVPAYSYSAGGVSAHEYMHTLGAKDLYVRGSNGDTVNKPVAIWDNMASSGSYSWPLAITRERLGWTILNEVNQAGTYTLHSIGSGQQAIKVKSPLNSNEYFVIEYRHKGNGYIGSDVMDKYIGASGLIVYRVNPALDDEGNAAPSSQGYNVYVFRPADTDNTYKGGDGNTSSSYISAQNAVINATGTFRNAIGSTDLNASFNDDALVYSNGINSGIKITAVTDGDGSCTFDLEFADYQADSGSWSETGDVPEGFNSQGIWNTSTATDGTNLYVVKNTSNSATVYLYDGSSWKQLGSPIADAASYATTIAWYKDHLYLLTQNYSAAGAKLYRFSDNVWQQVGTISLTGQGNAASLAVVGSKLCVFASNGADWGKSATQQVYQYDGDTLIKLGPLFTSGSISKAVLTEIGGNPAIVYSDQRTVVMSLRNGSWNALTSTGNAVAMLDAAMAGDGSTYVLSYQSGSSQGSYSLMKFNADGELQQTDEVTGLPANCVGLALSGGLKQLFVVALDNTGVGKSFAADLNSPTTFAEQNGRFAVSASSSLDAVMIGNKLYMAAADYSANMLTVRYQTVGDSVAPGGNGESASSSTIPAVTFDAASLTLLGEIGVNIFAKSLPDRVKNDSGATITFSKEGCADKTSYVKNHLQNDGRYKFTYEIVAKEMNDIFTAMIRLSDGTQVPIKTSNGSYGNNGGFSYKVTSFLNYVKDNSQDEKFKKLAVAMDNYGRCAQRLFNYHADEAGQVDSNTAVTADVLKQYELQKNGQVNGIQLTAASLDLETRTSLNLVFTLSNGRSIGGYTFAIDGKTMSPQLRSDGKYQLKISNIPSKDLGNMHQVVVKGGDGSAQTIQVAPLTYAYSVMELYGQDTSQTKLCDLVRALYVYNQAASDFLGGQR